MINRSKIQSREWVSFHKSSSVYGIEFLHANFVTHRFSRHVHDYFVVGIIESGLQTFDFRGEKQRTAPSGIIILNPDDPHTGEPASPVGFGYKALYPPVSLLNGIAADITGKANAQPFFTEPVIYDPEAASQLRVLHRLLLGTSDDGLAGESAFLEFFATLITRYADRRYITASIGREQTAVQRLRDYIEANYDKNLTLDELARLVAFSPYYLARTFTAEVGIPPHAYLESVRIRHAKRLLLLAMPIAEVALLTGFPHQSHFTTRFRRAVGITPGEYIKQSGTPASIKQGKIAQDNRSH